MDALKIQTDLLKKVFKGNGFKINYGMWDDETMGVIPDGHYLALIPLKNLYLNMFNVCNGKAPFKMDSFKEGEKKTVELVDTKTSRKVDKGTVRILKCSTENDDIWVDESILKMFDTNIATYMGTNSVSPVYVYEMDKLAGVIMPVVHKEG